MLLWTLKSFVGEDKVKIVKSWCEAQTDDVWGAFVFHLKYLAGVPPARWVRPWVALLHGGKRTRKAGCVGLVELIFEVGNIQYRPLGYFSGKMEFTILFFAIENGGEFEPSTACRIAKERIAIIKADKERAREFRL
jgi:hypothetical protein